MPSMSRLRVPSNDAFWILFAFLISSLTYIFLSVTGVDTTSKKIYRISSKFEIILDKF